MFRSTLAGALRALTLMAALGAFGTAAMAQTSPSEANVQLAREASSKLRRLPD